MSEVYYKVTRRGNISAVVNGHASVIYSKDKYVTAPDWLAERGYYLTVFKSLRAAKAFAWGEHEIWECKVKELQNTRLPFRDMAELAHGRLGLGSGGAYPAGTTWAKEVKLIRRVQ